MRGIPVRYVVDVALGGGGSDETAVSDRHVYNSVFEIQMFFELYIFRQNVSHLDSVLIVKIGFPVVIGYLFIDDLSKDDIAVATCSSAEGAI